MDAYCCTSLDFSLGYVGGRAICRLGTLCEESEFERTAMSLPYFSRFFFHSSKKNFSQETKKEETDEKKILTLVLAVTTATMLAGCGNTVKKDDSGEVVIEETDAAGDETAAGADTPEETSAAETEKEETDATDTVKEEAESAEPEKEPEPADWLEAHGITVTPQGDCTVQFYGYQDDASNPSGDFPAKVNAVISETTEGVDKGFKKVSMRFTIDKSDCTGTGCKWWNSAFDRYTGTSFEFDSSTTYTNPGDHVTKEGFVTIQNGDASYDVSITFDYEAQDLIIYSTITVTCPADYDGTVFQIGYASPELEEQNQQIDYAARLYTIDELPFYGDGYLYFTNSNE